MKHRNLLRWTISIGIMMLIPSFLYLGFGLNAFQEEGTTGWWLLCMFGFIFTLAPAMSILFISEIWKKIDTIEKLERNLKRWKEDYEKAVREYHHAKESLGDISIKMQEDIRKVVEHIENKTKNDEETKNLSHPIINPTKR